MAVTAITRDFASDVSLVRMICSNTLAEVTADGYIAAQADNIKALNSGTWEWLESDMVLAYATDGHVFGEFVDGDFTTLSILPAGSGDVTLPVTDNYITVFDGTLGALKQADASSTIISPSNIQAGLSGQAGYLASFPSTATKGSLRIVAVANTGNTVTTITNDAMGQASVISMPDPGVASTKFILADSTGSQGINTGGLQALQGSFFAGSSGHAGTFASYPATASKGYLLVSATANTGDTITTLTNTAMGQVSSIRISDPAAAIGYINTSTVNASRTPVGCFITKDVVCTFTALASAGQVIVLAAVAGMTFKVRGIFVNYGASGLSGGGGNRLLVLTDGTTVYNNAGITAALLGTPINTVWGGTGNPLAGTVSQQLSFTNDLYFQYSGGTTDYTAGSVLITVALERVG